MRATVALAWTQMLVFALLMLVFFERFNQSITIYLVYTAIWLVIVQPSACYINILFGLYTEDLIEWYYHFFLAAVLFPLYSLMGLDLPFFVIGFQLLYTLKDSFGGITAIIKLLSAMVFLIVTLCVTLRSRRARSRQD